MAEVHGQRPTLRRGGPRDLAALAACLRVGEEICADVSSQEAPPAEIASACAALSLADKPRLSAFAQQVAAALARDLPVQARDGGFIAPGFDPALDETRTLKEDAPWKTNALTTKFVDSGTVFVDQASAQQ